MARYILSLSIESEFYREFHENGHLEEELLEQLKGDIEDQVSEYNLPQLIKRMISFEGAMELPILVDLDAQKKTSSHQMPCKSS